MKKSLFIILIFFSLFSINQLVLAEEQNLTDKELSIQCINNSEVILKELIENDFSYQRINDSIKQMNDFLEVQSSLEEKGRATDYSNILNLCDEIVSIKTSAFDLRDEIKVLEDFKEISLEGIESNETEDLLEEIHKEMKNERYELVPKLIEETYSSIIMAQSRATTLNVFYDATTKGLKRFFKENWLYIVISLFILLILFKIFKKPVKIKILKNKLYLVEARRKSLKDMVLKNQDDYFNKGDISEEAFSVRGKKLVELLRDNDREISILKQQLYALNKKEFKLEISESEGHKKVHKHEAIKKNVNHPTKPIKKNITKKPIKKTKKKSKK